MGNLKSEILSTKQIPKFQIVISRFRKLDIRYCLGFSAWNLGFQLIGRI